MAEAEDSGAAIRHARFSGKAISANVFTTTEARPCHQLPASGHVNP